MLGLLGPCFSEQRLIAYFMFLRFSLLTCIAATFCLACSILNALGAIAFAYSFSLILLEIQDTLRQPPNTIRTMKRAVDLGVGMSFVFYITVAVAGYLAFGNGA